MVRLHVGLVPEQSPRHARKVEPFDGSAVRVTTEPGVAAPAQLGLHATPEGELVTVPEPLPKTETVSATPESGSWPASRPPSWPASRPPSCPPSPPSGPPGAGLHVHDDIHVA